MNLKEKIKKLFWGFDIHISRFSNHVFGRHKRLIKTYEIDVVLDVGANTGQFAKQMRDVMGFSGKIISFEPVSVSYELLDLNAKEDPKWEIRQFALGDSNREEEINIAKNSYSSSFLKMQLQHLQAAPESAYLGKEIVNIKTLDSVFNNICSKEDNVYLKIDTQGYESKILKGAKESLKTIDTIQLEMSLVPLYQDEMLFIDLYELLKNKGYSLVSLEPGFFDKSTGELLQVDGIFRKEK